MNTQQISENYLTYIKDLFVKRFGAPIQEVKPIPPSGSDRRYFILRNQSAVALGAYNPDLKENKSYFYFTEHFLNQKLPVPKVLAKDEENGVYLLEYIEGVSLLDWIKQKGYTPEVKELYKQVVNYLTRFQLDALEQIDFSYCHASEIFDQTQAFADLMYFKYYFLDLHKVRYDKNALIHELRKLSETIENRAILGFMYRDFQARNIIVTPERNPYFIDFQGGMKGVLQYDIVSLLWQAKAKLPDDWKQELFDNYFQNVKSHKNFPRSVTAQTFYKLYQDCILLRILQTLGAYGFRGLIEKKEHFIQSIRPALIQLKTFLDNYFRLSDYPELKKVLCHLVSEKFLNKYPELSSDSLRNLDKLQVDIYSFSFKKGTAVDKSGNGGGFIFDCRGILNPGREEAYKSLTGKDEEVIQFLESKTQMPKFLQGVFDVIDIHVQDFINRGFEHLSISFGCTGGQHRSVYAAEQTAKHLREKFGLNNVFVKHLEQEQHNLERVYGGEA